MHVRGCVCVRVRVWSHDLQSQSRSWNCTCRCPGSGLKVRGSVKGCRRGQSLVVWAINEGRGVAKACSDFLYSRYAPENTCEGVYYT